MHACQTLGRPSSYAALTPSPCQNTYIEVTVSCGKRLAATCYTSAFKACDTEWNAIVDVEMAVHRVLTRAGFPEVSARAAALAPAILRPPHIPPVSIDWVRLRPEGRDGHLHAVEEGDALQPVAVASQARYCCTLLCPLLSSTSPPHAPAPLTHAT